MEKVPKSKKDSILRVSFENEDNTSPTNETKNMQGNSEFRKAQRKKKKYKKTVTHNDSLDQSSDEDNNSNSRLRKQKTHLITEDSNVPNEGKIEKPNRKSEHTGKKDIDSRHSNQKADVIVKNDATTDKNSKEERRNPSSRRNTLTSRLSEKRFKRLLSPYRDTDSENYDFVDGDVGPTARSLDSNSDKWSLAENHKPSPVLQTQGRINFPPITTNESFKSKTNFIFKHIKPDIVLPQPYAVKEWVLEDEEDDNLMEEILLSLQLRAKERYGTSPFYLMKPKLRYLKSDMNIEKKPKSAHKDNSGDNELIQKKRLTKIIRNFEKRNYKKIMTKLSKVESMFIDKNSLNDSILEAESVLEDMSALSLSLSLSRDFHSFKNLGATLNRSETGQLLINMGRRMSLKRAGLHRLASEPVIINETRAQFLQTGQHKTPIERLQRLTRLIMILLRSLGSKSITRKRADEQDFKLLSWTHVLDETMIESRLKYGDHGLQFDPEAYKAKRESSLTEDVKEILRQLPKERTDLQIHAALVCFSQVIPAFSEFPRRIQQSMLKCCTYEEFEAGRVIIRQGHRAENFYFIVSGEAVVTILASGEDHVHTVNILGKGNSFGELAFLGMSKRTATVTCRDKVELLCIEREDFIDIFMRVRAGREPEHIGFLKSLDLLKGFPIDKLPHDNPKICAFTYVRKGVILCVDSTKSDLLFVVISGSCKVLKALNNNDKQALKGRYTQSLLEPLSMLRRRDCLDEQKYKSGQGFYLKDLIEKPPEAVLLEESKHLQHLDNIYYNRHILSNTTEDTPTSSNRYTEPASDSLSAITSNATGAPSPPSSYVHSDDLFWDQHDSPTVSRRSSELVISPSPSNSVQDEAQEMKQDRRKKKVSIIVPPKQNVRFAKRHSKSSEASPHSTSSSHRFSLPKINSQTPSSMSTTSSQSQPKSDKVFIHMVRLEPGDIFGLDHLILHGVRDVSSGSLVSDGAEVVIINKKFFRKHLDEDTVKRMRERIRPLPSEDVLYENFENQKTWDAYKTVVLHDYTQLMSEREPMRPIQPVV